MKENSLKKSNTTMFILLAVFFFVRTALLSPVYCFLMNADYPYFRFSYGAVAYIILAVALSLISAKLSFVFRDKVGEIGALIYILAMSDPLFFGTKHNAFKLLADIIIELVILNALSEKKLVSTKILLPVALLITTFLVPFSIIGYVPVILGICILVGKKAKKESQGIKIVVSATACVVAGFVLNKLLMNAIPAFNEWVTAFTFADIAEVTKHFRLVGAVLPAVIYSVLFFRYYKKTVKGSGKKKSDKNESFDNAMDAFFLPTVILFVAMFFMGAESFCAINIIVPSIVLTLLYLKDEACLRAIEEITCLLKKYKVAAVIVFFVMLVIALKGAEDYNPAKQLLFYIIY